MLSKGHKHINCLEDFRNLNLLWASLAAIPAGCALYRRHRKKLCSNFLQQFMFHFIDRLEILKRLQVVLHLYGITHS